MGERKVRTLLRAGASVSVISPEVTPRSAVRGTKEDPTHLAGLPHGRSRKNRFHQKRWAVKIPACPSRSRLRPTNSSPAQELITKDAETLGIPGMPPMTRKSPGSLSPPRFHRAIFRSPSRPPEPARHWPVNFGGGPSSTPRANTADISNFCEARKQVISTVSDEAQRAKIFRQLTGVEVMKWLWKGPAPPGCGGCEGVAGKTNGERSKQILE